MTLTQEKREELVTNTASLLQCNSCRKPLSKLKDAVLVRVHNTVKAMDGMSPADKLAAAKIVANAKAEGSNADVIGDKKFDQAGGKGTKDEFKLSGNDHTAEESEKTDDELENPGHPGTVKKSPHVENREIDSWLQANSAPPALTELIGYAREGQRAEKHKLVSAIVTNSGHLTRAQQEEWGQELIGLSLPTLRRFAQRVVNTNHHRFMLRTETQPLFAGSSAPLTSNVSVVDDAEDILPMPTMNFEQIAKESRDKDKERQPHRKQG